jgi:hypothetical protein
MDGRVPSSRWRGTGILCGLGGLAGGLVAVILIGTIDNTDDVVVAQSIAQNVVITVALVIGSVLAVTGIGCCIAFWRRPAAQLAADGILVRNWRAVFVPWPLIADAAIPQLSTGGARPGLLLKNGQVVALRYAASIASYPTAEQQYENSPVLHQLRAAIPGGNTRSEPPALIPAARVAEGSLGRQDLPGPAVTTLPRSRMPARMYSLFYVGLIIVVRVLLNAHGFFSGNTVLAIATVVGLICVVLVAAWTRMNRQVIIGADWIAWRPRVTTRWYVLPYTQVVSLTVRQPNRLTPELVRLRRADGRGIGLRPEEIRAGAGQPLLEAFADSAALTSQARRLLDRPVITDFHPSHARE